MCIHAENLLSSLFQKNQSMIEWTEIATRLALAAIFGAIIGIERERKNWVAGLRTHMLVCVGSALAMIVSAYGFMDVLSEGRIVLDPARVAAQVISGIGFLGAGTILFLESGGIVRGLTTAAGLWTVAAIGLATGSGMYFAALITTALAIIILFLLQVLENKFAGKYKKRKLEIVTPNEMKSLQIVNDVFENEFLHVSSCSVKKEPHAYTILFTLHKADKRQLNQLINKVQADPDVQEVLWE